VRRALSRGRSTAAKGATLTVDLLHMHNAKHTRASLSASASDVVAEYNKCLIELYFSFW
jgi:hypothetical protein